MPLWMHILGYKFLKINQSLNKIRNPYVRFFEILFGLLVLPILIGMAISYWRPTWAAKARKALRPFVICFLIFVIIFGIATHYYYFLLISWPIVFS